MKKNLDNEYDDTWRRKGHVHEGKENYPDVCPACCGVGFDDNGDECTECDGLGEVWE
jgi:DnaJ-class molecular chaperone